jgi:hypothetical protein
MPTTPHVEKQGHRRDADIERYEAEPTRRPAISWIGSLGGYLVTQPAASIRRLHVIDVDQRE